MLKRVIGFTIIWFVVVMLFSAAALMVKAAEQARAAQEAVTQRVIDSHAQ